MLQSIIFYSCPEFDTSQYEPIALNVAHPKYNCVSACLSNIVKGNRTQASEFEKLFVKLRTGSNKNLYDIPGKIILSRAIEDADFINTIDRRLLARQFRIKIFTSIMLPTTNNLTTLAYLRLKRDFFEAAYFSISSWRRGHRNAL